MKGDFLKRWYERKRNRANLPTKFFPLFGRLWEKVGQNRSTCDASIVRMYGAVGNFGRFLAHVLRKIARNFSKELKQFSEKAHAIFRKSTKISKNRTQFFQFFQPNIKRNRYAEKVSEDNKVSRYTKKYEKQSVCSFIIFIYLFSLVMG